MCRKTLPSSRNLLAWNGWASWPLATTWTGRQCRKCIISGGSLTAASAGRGCNSYRWPWPWRCLYLALDGDGKSGAIGAVTGELIAEAYVNSWISEKLADPASLQKLQGDALRAELAKLETEITELRRKGVDIARLGAGMGAALTGGDINVAAQTGGNAAENNALPLVLIIYGACEAIDGGIKLYNAYKLAEAIDNQDEEGIIKYGGEIVVDSTIGAVPLSGALTKLGMTKVGMMIAGIGAKVGDNVTNLVTKLGPDKAVDAIRNADD